METSTPQRADDRARALRRLRAMTIGTALAGVAATGGFGWLAATTHPGSSATVASVDNATTGGSTTGTSTTSGAPTATATASPTSTTTGSSSSGVSSAPGGAQVSTGGS